MALRDRQDSLDGLPWGRAMYSVHMIGRPNGASSLIRDSKVAGLA